MSEVSATFTLSDFHDDFHGSALAHASLPVLQALHCAVGGCCGGERWQGEGQGEGKKKGEKREDDAVVNEHVHNAQN